MQLTFGDAEGLGQRRMTRHELFLNEMDQVVPLEAAAGADRAALAAYRPERSPAVSAAAMLCIHVLQQWYALSAPSMEEALYDSAVLRRSSGINSLERIPDETNILNLRRLLETCGLGA